MANIMQKTNLTIDFMGPVIPTYGIKNSHQIIDEGLLRNLNEARIDLLNRSAEGGTNVLLEDKVHSVYINVDAWKSGRVELTCLTQQGLDAHVVTTQSIFEGSAMEVNYLPYDKVMELNSHYRSYVITMLGECMKIHGKSVLEDLGRKVDLSKLFT